MKTQVVDEERGESLVDSKTGWRPWLATRPLALGGEAWVIHWWEWQEKAGERKRKHIRKQFQTDADARKWAAEENRRRNKEAELTRRAERRGDNAVSLANLTPAEKVAVVAAIQKLRDAGGKVETITEAARVFAKTHLNGAKTTVAELLAEHLDGMQKAGKRRPTIRDRRLYLGSFIDTHGNTLAAAITTAQVEDWVLDADTPSKQASRRRAAHALFNYARKRGLIEKNPAAAVERPNELGPDHVSYLHPGEAEAVLRVVQTMEPRMVPYFAIGMFAGLRPQNELGRLDWRNINLKGGKITVVKSTAKTKKTRHPPISENLREWLESVPTEERHGQLFYSRRAYRRIIGFARVDAKGEPVTFTMRDGKPQYHKADKLKRVRWSPDIMRHSFCSYRQAQIKNIMQLVHEAGNTVAVAEEHYVNLDIEDTHVHRFWNIGPTPKKKDAE